MKTVKQACTSRASVFDPARHDTVLDLIRFREQMLSRAQAPRE